MPSLSASRYAYAVLSVLFAVLLRLAAEALLGRSYPFFAFLIAVGASAWFLGRLPAFAALAASTVVLFYGGSARLFIRSPPGLFSESPASLDAFVVFSALMIALIDFVHRTTVTARVASAELDRQQESIRRAQLAQAELAAIVASSSDAIVGKSLSGIITSWNQGAEQLFGYTSPEIVGRSITTIIPPERIAEEESVLSRIRAGQRVEAFDTVRIRKDGVPVEVSVAVSPIRDAAGVIVGAAKIARDISERSRLDRLREELLARERASAHEATLVRDRLAFLSVISGLLTSSLDYEETLDRAVHLALPRLGDYSVVFVQDEHGLLRHVASGHVIRDREPVIRELATRLVESPGRLGVPTFAEAVMKSGKTINVPHDVLADTVKRVERAAPELLELAEELRPFAYVGVPLHVRGRVVGVMAFGTSERESRREYGEADVTLIEEFARRVSLAVENARLFRQADELNRLKDEFLATLSHELRTPLAAVLGWARMLGGGQLDDEKAAQAVRAIERNAEAQSKIVDDILDVARGMAGNLPLDMKRLDLAAVVLRSVEAIAPSAAAKTIQVDVRAPEAVTVLGDAGRLQQVTWNLLSNAVKFTPPGGRVTIDVLRRDGDAQVEVTDSGIGIPQAFLPFVFDKFRQADGSFTRQYGGLGLGLAIARHLVELHGGSIEAHSEGEGSGASFRVRFPLASD